MTSLMSCPRRHELTIMRGCSFLLCSRSRSPPARDERRGWTEILRDLSARMATNPPQNIVAIAFRTRRLSLQDCATSSLNRQLVGRIYWGNGVREDFTVLSAAADLCIRRQHAILSALEIPIPNRRTTFSSLSRICCAKRKASSSVSLSS